MQAEKACCSGCAVLCVLCHSLKLSPAAGVKIQQPRYPGPFSRFWGVAWPLSQKGQLAHCSGAVCDVQGSHLSLAHPELVLRAVLALTQWL